MNDQTLFVNPFYSLEKDIHENFHFLKSYIIFFPENNKILYITKEENFLIFSNRDICFRLEFSESILKKFECLLKERNIIEKIKHTHDFFKDTIIPKMKNLNLPCWKLSFEELTKEDSKKLFEQYELSQKRQNDLQKFSSYYQKEFYLAIRYNQSSGNHYKCNKSLTNEEKLVENYFKMFHNEPLRAYSLELKGLNENPQNIEICNFYASPQEMSAHEKYHFKKILKNSGLID